MIYSENLTQINFPLIKKWASLKGRGVIDGFVHFQDRLKHVNLRAGFTVLPRKSRFRKSWNHLWFEFLLRSGSRRRWTQEIFSSCASKGHLALGQKDNYVFLGKWVERFTAFAFSFLSASSSPLAYLSEGRKLHSSRRCFLPQLFLLILKILSKSEQKVEEDVKGWRMKEKNLFRRISSLQAKFLILKTEKSSHDNFQR